MPSTQTRKKQKPKKLIRKFKAGLKQNEVFGNAKLVPLPPGVEKMSEVLLRFIRPYERRATSEEDYQKLIGVATVAWNATLLPPHERQAALDTSLQRWFPEHRNDLELVIKELIHRKERYFRDYSRLIVHYQVTMIEDYVHLRVASTPVAGEFRGHNTGIPGTQHCFSLRSLSWPPR